MKKALRNHKAKYTLFFAYLLISFIVTRILVQINIIEQEQYAQIINQSGRQRMLSQKLAKNVALLGLENKVGNKDKFLIKSKIRKVLDRLEKSQQELIDLSQKEGMNKTIDSLLRLNSKNIEDLSTYTSRILAQSGKQLTSFNPFFEKEQEFLAVMEATVDQFQQAAEEKLKWLRFFEIALAILWLAGIITIFLYIINPFLKGIISLNNNLSVANTKLAESEKLLSANVDKLALAKEKLEENRLTDLQFIKQSPQAVAMFNKKMEYLAASDQWIQDYGLKNREIIGKSHYDIFPEIGEDWKAIHRRCLNGGIDKNEGASFEGLDGSLQWLKWDVRPWYAEEGIVGGLIMSTADITAKKNQEIEKSRLQAVLDEMSKVARIGVWELNLQTGTVKWDDTTKVIHELPLDYEPELSTGINFYQEGESRQKIQVLLNKCINDGLPFDDEFELLTYKKNSIWVRCAGQAEFKKGKCIRVFGVFQDINSRIQRQKSLEEANAKLKNLTDTLTKQNR